MIEQLSSAGCVAEVLETLSDQDQVKNDLSTLAGTISQVETQHITQAVATIHHLQKLAHHVGQVRYNTVEDGTLNKT